MRKNLITKFIRPSTLQSKLLAFPTLPILTKRDLCRLMGISQKMADRIIHQAIQENILVRLKPGLYSLFVRPPQSFLIANYLLQPSYLSLESALSYHHLIPETVYSITSVTPIYSKTVICQNQAYVYHKINPRLFFGYQKISLGDAEVLMADKEKTLLDYFYFVVRGLRTVNSRLTYANLDREKLAAYVTQFEQAIQGRKRVAFRRLIHTHIDL